MSQEQQEHDSKRMNVKMLSQIVGISRSTIYQYLRSGLLHAPLNEGPTQMRYDQSHLNRLKEIRYLQDKRKLSLAAIKKTLQVSMPQETDTEKNIVDVKNMIVDKAIELISEKGFAKTKIGDIAEKLNMGKGTFYLYFKNKEDLFLKCIERFSEIFLPKEKWQEIRKEREFSNRTYKRYFYLLDSFKSYMGIISIVKLAIRGTDEDLSQRAKNCYQVILDPAIKELKRYIEKGEIRNIDVQFVSFLMLGVGEAAGYWRMIHPECSLEETAEKVLDFVTYGLNPGRIFDQKEGHGGRLEAIVEDVSGTKITLQGLLYDNQENISVILGNGILQLDLPKVKVMEITPNGSDRSAKVTMISGESVQTKIDGNIEVSGDLPFGKFKITMSQVRRITISHE